MTYYKRNDKLEEVTKAFDEFKQPKELQGTEAFEFDRKKGKFTEIEERLEKIEKYYERNKPAKRLPIKPQEEVYDYVRGKKAKPKDEEKEDKKEEKKNKNMDGKKDKFRWVALFTILGIVLIFMVGLGYLIWQDKFKTDISQNQEVNDGDVNVICNQTCPSQNFTCSPNIYVNLDDYQIENNGNETNSST